MTAKITLFEAQRRQKREQMNGAHGPDEVGGDEGPGSGQRVIQIKAAEQARVVDETEEALIEENARVYVRAGRLVQPILEEALATGGRPTVVARLKELCLDSLTDLIGRVITFKRYSENRRQWVKTDPPRWVASHLLARNGLWKLPRLSGVITTPTLRPDGSILQEPGYDPATRLYLLLDPDLRLPVISRHPSRQEAERALDLLTDLISGFPFVGPVDRAVALSGILTTVLRPTLPVVPLHAIRAHTSGTGKSYLVDVFTAIATGRPCPATSVAKSEEETEKRLAAHLLQGDAIISLDNVNGELGGDLLCQMTERSLVRPRILGRSEAPEVECRAMPFATGNNLIIVGDMTRRTVLSSLDANVERPEQRHFDFLPVDRVLADRGAYVAAVLTILLAYRAAGSPKVCGPLGSYGAWSGTVRSALIWLGEADPVLSMETTREEDPKLGGQRELFEHWQEYLTEGRFYSVTEIINTACEAYTDGDFLRPQFRDLLMRMTRANSAKPSANSLGRWFSDLHGRVAGGFRLDVAKDEKRGNRYGLLRVRDGDPDEGT
ncbi:hypothetical protein MBRA_06330 [Methylobacterium brachiatum]|nr:hypothetical protein MBRA_06330 [Methylobacterium brachiatum]